MWQRCALAHIHAIISLCSLICSAIYICAFEWAQKTTTTTSAAYNRETDRTVRGIDTYTETRRETQTHSQMYEWVFATFNICLYVLVYAKEDNTDFERQKQQTYPYIKWNIFAAMLFFMGLCIRFAVRSLLLLLLLLLTSFFPFILCLLVFCVDSIRIRSHTLCVDIWHVWLVFRIARFQRTFEIGANETNIHYSGPYILPCIWQREKIHTQTFYILYVLNRVLDILTITITHVVCIRPTSWKHSSLSLSPSKIESVAVTATSASTAASAGKMPNA